MNVCVQIDRMKERYVSKETCAERLESAIGMYVALIPCLLFVVPPLLAAVLVLVAVEWEMRRADRQKAEK